MYKLQKLNNLKKIIENLDLTNSILVQIGMFLNDSDKYCYIDENDERVLKNENNKKFLNNLMNVLLDGLVSNNKSLYEKTNEILSQIPDDHELKKNLIEVFKNTTNEILENEKDRFDDLKSKKRKSTIENKIKFKEIEGFIKIYKKPTGMWPGELNFKAIAQAGNDKEKKSMKEIGKKANILIFG